MLKQWNRSVRSLRRRRQNRWAVEQLEDRSLLSAVGFENLEVDASSYSDSQIVVQFNPDANLNPNQLPLPGVKLGGSLGAAGLYQVYLDSSVSPEDAVAAFADDSSVEYAHPDFNIQLSAIPNDPDFNQLWGMHNTGQSNGTVDADIDAAEAWDVRTDASDVIVAVIDTGVDYNHPDLVDNMWTNTGEIAGDGIDNDGNGFVDDIYGYDFFNGDGDPMDDHNHGTHVAGTIGAQGNNGVGVAGVAWDVQIMALKFLGGNGSGSSSGAIGAINYATQMGADIANNSWGGGGFSQSLQNAINNFTNNDGIFTAAAGNHGGDNDESAFYPANYNNVISVAASDRNDNLAGFSGFGKNTVDIAAPGVAIRSTIPNNRYANFNGTSMATPMVSGAFAVLKAEFPNDTNTQLIDRMMLSADSDVLGDVTTYGRLNLNEALKDDDDGGDDDETGPKVNSAEWSGDADAVDTVTVTFDEAISTGTFTPADVALEGPNGSIAVDAVTEVAGSGGTVFDVTFASQTDAGDYSMDIGPDIEDLAGNAMDQDMDGTGGEAGDDVFSTDYSIEDVTVFEWSGNVRLRDAVTRRGRIRRGRTAIRFDVNERVKIADLNVQITVNHTWDSDLAIYLYGGGGRSLLFNRRGGDGDNVFATFDDEAGTAIADGSAPFDGEFRPESSLSTFDGRYTDTRWYVMIYDLAPRDTGTITNVKLIVTPDNEGGATSFDGSDAPAQPIAAVNNSYQADVAQDDVLWTEDEQVRVPVSVVDVDSTTVVDSEDASDWRDDLEPTGFEVTPESQDLVFAAVDDSESFELFD